jgi:ribonuclease HI
MEKKYYSVKSGRKPGIYNTWEKCKEQVIGFPGAEYKKFSSHEEAEQFLGSESVKMDMETERLREGEASVYVDGSFDLETMSYSYGVVILTGKEIHRMSGREEDPEMALMRNVSGELKGAMKAMEWAIENEIRTLYLHYDYTGIERWAKGDWKTNKDGTKAYKAYFDNVKDKIKVEFIKVKAHSGNKYNEEADKLAKEAI